CPAVFEQGLGQLGVGKLDVGTNVIDAPPPALLQDQLDSTAVVINMHPAADVRSIPVQRDLQPVEQVGDEQRNDLHRILVRAISVAAPGDGYVQPVRAGIGTCYQVATCLRRGIRGTRV